MNDIEKAIEILKLYDYSTKLELSEGIRNHVVDDITVGEFMLMKRIAISALEKQMPKKPLEQSTDEKTYYKCICESIQKTAYKDGYQMGAERAYCDRCGQAIDWSVEE